MHAALSHNIQYLSSELDRQVFDIHYRIALERSSGQETSDKLRERMPQPSEEVHASANSLNSGMSSKGVMSPRPTYLAKSLHG